MSVTIPPDFPDWLTRWVIGHFPVGKPKDIRAAADAWARSAERLKVTLAHLERLARDVPAAIQGEAGEAIQKQLKTEIANTRNQIEFADGMATLLYDSANAIELEQYIVIGIAAVLLANLLIDTAVPMKAASDRIAADVAATAARRDTLAFMFQRIAAFMQRFPGMGLAIRATIMGAASMGGVVAGAQYAQILQGHGKPGRRTSMDWSQVWVAATASGAGGLAGALATRAVLPALTRVAANAATPAGRTTGRVVAVVLASATGGAAGGAGAAVVVAELTDTELTGRNLAEMVMMGVGSGVVAGVSAAVRATRAMNAAELPEGTGPELGRSGSDSSRDGLAVRSAPELARPHSSTDTPRAHEETSPAIGGSRNDSSQDVLSVRSEPESTDQHAVGDGDAPWQRPEETIDKIGEPYEEAFERLDKGGPSDPNQPPPDAPHGTPASPTSPGSTPEAGHGWSSWDDALRALTDDALQGHTERSFGAAPADPMATPGRLQGLLTEGTFAGAPADRTATPGSLLSTGHPGTAQFSRPDAAPMNLAGDVRAADSQPGSVLTMSADTHAENVPHVASAKDLGGTGGGNGPDVTAGSLGSQGNSPTGGGPGSRPPVTGKGPGQLSPDPDLLNLDFFDFESAPNEPVAAADNSPTATSRATGTAPVEPGLGSESGPTPSPAPMETKSPTAQAGATPGPGVAPATPTATPAANAPHANPPQHPNATPPQQPHATPQGSPRQQPHVNPQAAQANTPQPHAAAQANTPQPLPNQQGAQAHSPLQPHVATSPPSPAVNNLADQAIPPAALASAAALSGHGPSNPDAASELSAPLPALSGGHPADNDQTPSDPREFPDQNEIGTVVKPPMPSYVPAQPQVDESPYKEAERHPERPGTTYTRPGQPDPPHGPPPNAIPIVPHPTAPAIPDTGSAIPLTDRPQVPIPDTAIPGAPAEDERGQKLLVHDSEPPRPRHNNNPAPHLPAAPADRPTELNPPSHYATTPNPQTPGAPTDPGGRPQLNRDSTQYIPDPTIQPTRGGTPATSLAGPLPEPVVAARPVPMASADKPKRGKRKQDTPPPPPPPEPLVGRNQEGRAFRLPGKRRKHSAAGASAEPGQTPAAESAPSSPAEPSQEPEESVSPKQLLTTNKAYRNGLYIPNAVSNIGFSIQESALPLAMLELTHSPVAAGFTVFAPMAARALSEPLAGYAADFHDRVKIMLAAQWASVTAATGAATAVALGVPHIGPVLTGTTLVEGVAATFYLRSLLRTVPDLVTPEQLTAANRMAEIDRYVAGTGGRALGPIVLNVANWLPFAANGVSSLWNLAALSRLPESLPPHAPKGRHAFRDIFTDVRDGARAVLDEPFLREYTLVITATNAAFGMLSLRTAAIIDEAQMHALATAAVVSAGAVGGVIGGLLPKKVISTAKINLLFPAALSGFAAVAALQAATANPFIVAVGSLGTAVIGVGMNVRVAGHVQQAVPKKLWARANSATSLVMYSGAAAGPLLGGAVLSTQGIFIQGWMAAGIVGAAAVGVAAHRAATIGGAAHQLIRRVFGLHQRGSETLPVSETESSGAHSDSTRADGTDPLVELISDVNPLGNGNNCAECAIVTDLRIDGRTNMVAAPSTTGRTGGRDTDGRHDLPFIEAHYQTTFRPVRSLTDVEDELIEGDHLARGIIVYYDHSRLDDKQQPTAHAVNVVNDDGTIRYLDGQYGRDVTTDLRATGNRLTVPERQIDSNRPPIEAYFLRTDGRYTGFQHGAPHIRRPAPNRPIITGTDATPDSEQANSWLAQARALRERGPGS
ncbi:MFS transporter [Nocardia sp. CA-120079]|uniref:MFS transporter n=1 Tax=Nocardia sp. CA-120079 TaxID=3239974 RepID=UPI003D996270